MTFACGPEGVSVATTGVSVGGADGWVLAIVGTDVWVMTAGVVVERSQAKAKMDRLTITKGIRFISSPFDTIIGFFSARTHSIYKGNPLFTLFLPGKESVELVKIFF